MRSVPECATNVVMRALIVKLFFCAHTYKHIHTRTCGCDGHDVSVANCRVDGHREVDGAPDVPLGLVQVHLVDAEQAPIADQRRHGVIVRLYGAHRLDRVEAKRGVLKR